jgi:hypothetical protein
MTHSQKRRAENEVVFRQRNDAIKDLVKDLQDTNDPADVTVEFICECANEDCRETINLTIAEYEKARKNTRHFIIKPGHEQNDLEKVVQRDGFLLVEKFEEPPVTDGVLNVTH